MKDQLALLLYGCIFAALAWVSWHWWGGYITFVVLVILLLGYAVDNFQLRRQVRGLLMERDQRQRKNALQRLVAGLIAAREHKAGKR
ncbi:hypothetical protein GTP45_13120 [Pseudoduganella sp. FT55W]|uniref:Uncharacterized protein n=1 Tax=Duganella rivi TaxID=2666083 RepID=A0A7X4GSD6_9BURK|nr:hypothetical protein [Duganella rivi]MYM67769.1 hypothetical protein [Duganella rivi]